MLRNSINRQDLAALVDVARWQRVVRRVSKRRATRVGEHFSNKHRQLWVSNPMVQAHISELVSGDSATSFPKYACQKYLGDKRGLHAVALGCGNGRQLMRWAANGNFETIDGYDLSAQRIDDARQAAESKGLSDVMRFAVADAYSVELEDGGFDAVIAEQAIHHFKPLRTVLERYANCLRPDGYLFVDEFVGPRRFQWTPRQIEAGDGMLATIPERFRVAATTGDLKRRFNHPSRLRMWMTDPSEAIESNLIEPLVEELFEVIERRPYGGTLLSPVLGDIAQNFAVDDPEARDCLQRCFAAEAALIASGEIGNDFVALVARTRRRP